VIENISVKAAVQDGEGGSKMEADEKGMCRRISAEEEGRGRWACWMLIADCIR